MYKTDKGRLKMKVDSRKSAKLIFDSSLNTSGITFSENLTKKYSPDVVEKAAQLKAKYGNKYSDMFYLDYAQRASYIYLIKRETELFKSQADIAPLTDPEWAEYSYEEIIQMENNGYVIPKDVLLWAHAQQEADITSYQIISTAAETDDNTATDQITDDSDINNLQKKVREAVVKVEKAKIENQQKVDEFNNDIQKAISVKNEKENTCKNSINQIKSFTKEWKELDRKSKNGTLTAFEQKRYIELGGILNGNNNSFVKDIQYDVLQLNDFLDSISLYDDFNDDNLELAQDAIKAGDDLATLDRKYPESMSQHALANLKVASTGGLSDMLLGTNSSEIPKMALTLGAELEVSTNDFIKTIQGQESNEIADFAQEYTQSADDIEGADTGNITGDSVIKQAQTNKNKAVAKTSRQTAPAGEDSQTTNTSTPTEASSQNEQSPSKTNPKFYVFPATSNPAFVAAAAVLATVSVADLAGKRDKAEDMKKKLTKDLTKANKDTKELEKANKIAEERHEGNMQTQDMYLAQLEAATQNRLAQQNEKAASAAEASAAKTSAAETSAAKTSAAETSAETPANNGGEEEDSQTSNPALSPEEENIISQLNELFSQDRLAGARAKIVQAKLQKSLKQTEKSSKVLTEQNDILTQRNKNNLSVGKNTIICGSITSVLGVLNFTVSEAMMATALSLISNPWTCALGYALMAVTVENQKIAIAQMVTGPLAVAAGSVGVATSHNVDGNIEDYKKTTLSASKNVNADYKTLRATNTLLKRWEDIETPSVELISQRTSPQTVQLPNTPSIPESINATGTSKTANVTFGQVTDVSQGPFGKNPTAIYNSSVVSDARNLTMSGKEQYQEKKQNLVDNLMSNTKSSGSSEPVINSYIGADKEKISSQSRIESRASNEQREVNTAKNLVNEKDSVISQMQQIDNESRGAVSDNKIDDIFANNLSKSKILEREFDNLYSTVENVNVESTNAIKPIQNEFDDSQNEVEKLIASGNSRLIQSLKVSNGTTSENQNISEDDEADAVLDAVAKSDIAKALNDDFSQSDYVAVSASAGVNGNINKNALTDDKLDRKLARFNNDSVIESKKKQRKVNAISASAGRSA